MFAYGIGISQPRLEEIRQRLKQGQLNALRELLPDRLIERVCCETGHRYRERLLPPLVMVFHYLAAALWPEDSFNAAAQSGGLPVSSGTLSKARQRLPQAVLDRLGSHTSQLAQTFSDEAARSRGFRLVSIDGTCVSMSDQPALRTAFGLANSKHGPSRYPAARLVVAMLAQTPGSSWTTAWGRTALRSRHWAWICSRPCGPGTCCWPTHILPVPTSIFAISSRVWTSSLRSTSD